MTDFGDDPPPAPPRRIIDLYSLDAVRLAAEDVCRSHERCLAVDELCDGARCAPADEVTGTCRAARQLAPRVEGGPVIFDVDLVASALSGCSGGELAHQLELRYHDGDGDVPTDAAALSVALSIALGTASSTAFVVKHAGDGADGALQAILCVQSPPAEIAVQLVDDAGHTSNAACALE